MLIIRRINCINTISGMSLYVSDRLVCRFGSNSVLSKTNSANEICDMTTTSETSNMFRSPFVAIFITQCLGTKITSLLQ